MPFLPRDGAFRKRRHASDKYFAVLKTCTAGRSLASRRIRHGVPIAAQPPEELCVNRRGVPTPIGVANSLILLVEKGSDFGAQLQPSDWMRRWSGLALHICPKARF